MSGRNSRIYGGFYALEDFASQYVLPKLVSGHLSEVRLSCEANDLGRSRGSDQGSYAVVIMAVEFRDRTRVNGPAAEIKGSYDLDDNDEFNASERVASEIYRLKNILQGKEELGGKCIGDRKDGNDIVLFIQKKMPVSQMNLPGFSQT